MSEEAEDLVSKYKRLLALARSNLEANQSSLQAKDKQINQLLAALEEEKEKSVRSKRISGVGSSNNSIGLSVGISGNNGSMKDTEDIQANPRSLLRRIDVDSVIWILVEYDTIEDAWMSFKNESDLDEYIQRISGVPLIKPLKSLTPQESAVIVQESKAKVDQITEEFRRFKVRSDIAKKQLMGMASPATPSTSLLPFQSPASSASNYMNNGSTNATSDDASEAEVVKWKAAYERAVKENEQLKTRGGDVSVLAQWKQRYESCLEEKEELAEKLKIYTRMSTAKPAGGVASASSIAPAPPNYTNRTNAPSSLPVAGNSESAKSIEQLYIDLRDEYKEYRRRATSLEKQRVQELDELRALLGSQLQSEDGGSRAYSSALNGQASGTNSTGSNPLTENKIAYLRQMVVRYLSCRDPVVRPHIESALVAMLRVNAEERSAIEERQKDEQSDDVMGSLYGITSVGGLDLSSITNFWGSFTS